MTKAFDKIKAGLDDALAHASGDENRGKVTTPTKPTARLSLTEHARMPNGVVMYWLADGVSLGTDDAELAALIVRAVNAHDGLVNNLAALERLCTEHAARVGPLHSWWDTIFDARAALAKTTGDD